MSIYMSCHVRLCGFFFFKPDKSLRIQKGKSKAVKQKGRQKKTQKDKQQPATLHRNYRLSNKNPAKKLSETKSYTNDTSVDLQQTYNFDLNSSIPATTKTPYFQRQCRINHCAYVCLSTGPRWPERPHLLANQNFTMDFCLCGAILNLKAFCFGGIPDILIELIAYWSVPQSRRS